MDLCELQASDSGSNRRLVILTLHGIGDPGRTLEQGEEDVWLSEDTFAAIIDVIRNRSDVMLTVDDGNLSDSDIIVPMLLECDMKATFFVAVGHLDSKGYLSRTDVRSIVQEGMRMGSHGIYHHNWRELSDEQLIDEMHNSKDILEQLTGQATTEAACPFGSYDRRVLRHLRRARFEKVYTSDTGPARRGDWLLPRNSLHSQDTPESVLRMLDQSSFSPKTLLCRLKTTIKRFR